MPDFKDGDKVRLFGCDGVILYLTDKGRKAVVQFTTYDGSSHVETHSLKDLVKA